MRIFDARQGPLETIDRDLLNLRPCPIYILVPRFEPNLDIQLTIFTPAVRIYVLNASLYYPTPNLYIQRRILYIQQTSVVFIILTYFPFSLFHFRFLHVVDCLERTLPRVKYTRAPSSLFLRSAAVMCCYFQSAADVPQWMLLSSFFVNLSIFE